MTDFLTRYSTTLDELTGMQGSLGYVAIALLVVWGYLYSTSSDSSVTEEKPKEQSRRSAPQENEEDERDPPRNFTAEQLRYFDGTKGDKGEDKPVYLSVAGTVFDVSDGRNFYGPDGPYEKFAGRECGAALAKMSFDEQLLGDFSALEHLNFGEKTELEGWLDKFTHYRNYPIKGRLVPDNRLPDPQRVLTADELTRNDGTGAIPEGYAAAPIFVGAGDQVFDVSFGGVSFYSPGKVYSKFAGRDASRALAKMSLELEDLQTGDTSDLTEKQIGTMNDWIKTFSERKRYPVVGLLNK